MHTQCRQGISAANRAITYQGNLSLTVRRSRCALRPLLEGLGRRCQKALYGGAESCCYCAASGYAASCSGYTDICVNEHGSCGRRPLVSSVYASPEGAFTNDKVLRLWYRICKLSAAFFRLLMIAATCLAGLASRSAPILATPPVCSITVSLSARGSAASGPVSAPLAVQECDGTIGVNSDAGVTNTATAPILPRGPAAFIPFCTSAPSQAQPLADLAEVTSTKAGTPSSGATYRASDHMLRNNRMHNSSTSIGQYDNAYPSEYPATGTLSASASSSSSPPYVAGAGGGGGMVTSPPGGGGGAGGGGAPRLASTGGAAISTAAVLGPDPDDFALAQQLGLDVSEARVVRLFERHRASVVNISGMRAMQTFTNLDLTKMPYGQGSGFLWGDKGHVVTCYHLVKGAAEVKVTLYDNTSYTAKVLGYDAAKNLAVLKLSVPKSKLRELQPVTPGSAVGLRVAQNVYGIGNPWGLGHTLSQGRVCGLGLELSAGLFPIKGLILTDGVPDPGSSGGVLLDSRGNLVGMLVAPPAGSGGGNGRAFAVPIDAVRGLITQILSYSRTVRPALGITMAPAQVLERVGVDGVLVLEVPPGSPAQAAGLRPTHRDIFGDLVLGDIIVGLDGKAVRSSSDVYDILDEHRVGDRIKVDVLRDGKANGLTVTLGERVLGTVEE